MNKLQALFESEVLNEDTKAALKEAIEGIQAEAIAEAKKDLEVEYAQKLEDKQSAVSAELFTMINEAVDQEVCELKDDINRYRDLEVEYAQKLEDFKAEYAQKLQESFESMVQENVSAEIVELKEDLLEAKKNNFGVEIFESFKNVFEEFGVSEDVKDLRVRLKESQQQLKAEKENVAIMTRKATMDTLLESVTGSKREVMKTILENVKTDDLESRFNEVIGKVLQEDVAPKAEESLDESVEGKKTLEESAESEKLARIRQLLG